MHKYIGPSPTRPWIGATTESRPDSGYRGGARAMGIVAGRKEDVTRVRERGRLSADRSHAEDGASREQGVLLSFADPAVEVLHPFVAVGNVLIDLVSLCREFALSVLANTH